MYVQYRTLRCLSITYLQEQNETMCFNVYFLVLIVCAIE